MGIRKYIKQYRLENVPDKKGKLVTRAVYKGDWFVYRETGEVLKKARTTVAVSTAVCIVAMITALLFFRNKGVTSQYYTLIPFAVCFLPLLYLSIAAYNVMITGEGKKVDLEHKDGIHDRIAKSSLGIMIFDGLCIIGIVVSLVLKMTGSDTRPFTANDAVFSAASAVMFAGALIAFSARKKLDMVKASEMQETTAETTD